MQHTGFVSILMLSLVGSAPPATVAPTVETDPVPDAEDAADDAAIWINRTDSSASRIIGTNKKGGLAVYSLDGEQVQYLAAGRVNNVDLRHGFTLGGAAVALVAASHRDAGAIRFWTVSDRTPELKAVPGEGVRVTVSEPYGLAMYRSAKSGEFYCFVNDTKGVVEQWKLGEAEGEVRGTLVRTLKLSGQVEGMCADDDLGWLYVGEETKGLWRFGAEPDSKDAPVAVDLAKPKGRMTPDVEGVAIRRVGAKGYLLASCQGSNSFMVYDRTPPNAFRGEFTIVGSGRIDGVSETDGVDVTSEPLGASFPHGLLVVQDGDNAGQTQNFKLVPWESVARALRIER